MRAGRAQSLTTSCFNPTKDCSTELAFRTCLFAAAFSPRKRSIKSFTASPWKECTETRQDSKMLKSANQNHHQPTSLLSPLVCAGPSVVRAQEAAPDQALEHCHPP